MVVTQYFGAHGTCEYAATAIRSGAPIKITQAGLAGNGFYLWAYPSLGKHQEAVQLARDWHDFYVSKNKYANVPVGQRGFAALLCQIGLKDGEWLDVSRPVSQQRIEHIFRGLPPDSERYEAYIQHVVEVAESRLEKYQIHLKMVVTSLPVPVPTRRRLGNPVLTPFAYTYIVLEAGIPYLKILPR